MKKLISWYPLLLIISVLLIFILGLLIRTSGIFSYNALFLFDNARDLIQIKKIAVDHSLVLVGPQSMALGGHFHGVFFTYILLVPFLLGNGNPIFFTVFIAICSSLSIIFTFWVLQKISNNYSAILGTIFYAFSSFSIATSTFIWNPYPIVWIAPFLVYALWNFVNRKKYSLVIIAVIISLMFHFESIYGIVLFPLLFICTIIHLFRKQEINAIKIKTIILSLILFTFPFVPGIIFDIRHDFISSRSLLTTIMSGGETLVHKDSSQKNIKQRLELRIADLYQYTIQSVTKNSTVNILIFALSLLSFISLCRKKNKPQLYFTVLLIIALISPFAVFLNLKYDVWSYYWIGNPAFYTLLIAFLIGIYLKDLKYGKPLLIIIIFLSLIALIPNIKIDNWTKGILNPGSGNLSTQIKVTRQIYDDAKNAPFSVYVITPPVYDYVYRYLFWWQGNTQYKRFPIDKKQLLVYIIIEQNLSDPDGMYFKKNVVNTNNYPSETFNIDGVKIQKIYTDKNELPVDQNYFPPLF